MKQTLILCLFLLCLAGIARAQNWPSFRGPNASGVADGAKLPTSWNVEKSENIFWSTAIPGMSHSSPIVWSNQVFLITAISSDDKVGFNAKAKGIDLAKLLWKKDLGVLNPGLWDDPKSSWGHSSSPVIYRDLDLNYWLRIRWGRP